MDIVEQLRKYQCPENKGCNPVVEYCQCALMDSSADKIKRLREALRYYANKKEEDCKNGQDDGVIARAALKES